MGTVCSFNFPSCQKLSGVFFFFFLNHMCVCVCGGYSGESARNSKKTTSKKREKKTRRKQEFFSFSQWPLCNLIRVRFIIQHDEPSSACKFNLHFLQQYPVIEVAQTAVGRLHLSASSFPFLVFKVDYGYSTYWNSTN